jgi:hypothetical protein
VLGGRYVILDSLADDELEAMQSMQLNDEAKSSIQPANRF